MTNPSASVRKMASSGFCRSDVDDEVHAASCSAVDQEEPGRPDEQEHAGC